jgi:hypothetical protein
MWPSVSRHGARDDDGLCNFKASLEPRRYLMLRLKDEAFLAGNAQRQHT